VVAFPNPKGAIGPTEGEEGPTRMGKGKQEGLQVLKIAEGGTENEST